MRYLAIFLCGCAFGQVARQDQSDTFSQTVTFTGTVIGTAATATRPLKTGTSVPASCTTGDGYIKTDATAGRNLYLCTATNTYTQQAAGPGTGHAFGCTFSSTATLTVNTICLFPIPYAGTIAAWNASMDDGTSTATCSGCSVTFKVWKIAAGTALPTVANVINTSGLVISSGTALRSTTVSDFTSLVVTAHDWGAVIITAVSGAPKTAGLTVEY